MQSYGAEELKQHQKLGIKLKIWNKLTKLDKLTFILSIYVIVELYICFIVPSLQEKE